VNNFGQLFITGISGKSLTEKEINFIQNKNIGGVILFAHNYEDPAQLAELVNELQKLRDEYPLFIAVDHEGGRVQRFKKGFSHFPPMYEISKFNSPKTTFEVHSIMGQELSACGINLNFSPVCDIWTNPQNKVIGDRSFGHEAEEVEKHVSAAIRGLQTHNVLACAKHFPGHGDTLKDSHFDLPLVKTSLNDMRKRELIPFVKAAKSRTEFIMMAHLMVDALDEELPTSLSPEAYQFLREELKYKKLIITDDMEMKAVADRFSFGEAAIRALSAGADVLIYRAMESCEEAYNSVIEAINQNQIDKKNLEDKVKRIFKCKIENFSNYTPIYIPSITAKMNSVENQKYLIDLAKKVEQLNQVDKGQ
jgi:beta-N-acetylhexosaminidase